MMCIHARLWVIASDCTRHPNVPGHILFEHFNSDIRKNIFYRNIFVRLVVYRVERQKCRSQNEEL